MSDQAESIHQIKLRKYQPKTKGSSGPLGMDADGWKWILTSKQFAESSSDLCTTIAKMIKKLRIDKDLANTLEAFLSCCLIPLNKNPGLEPMDAGEVLVGKVINSILWDIIITSVGPLQVQAGQESGSEAAIHAMSKMYKEQHTEAILLVDAANIFNFVNRKAFLHKNNIVCPLTSIYVQNCYALPSCLLINGGAEIKSSEGTRQGDPVAMSIYALSVILLMLKW